MQNLQFGGNFISQITAFCEIHKIKFYVKLSCFTVWLLISK